MRSRRIILASVWLACWLPCVPPAQAQDATLKDAITAQQQRSSAPSELDLRRRLNRKLLDLARQFFQSAKAEGLKFEDVIRNIDLRNAATEEFGLPLQVIKHDPSDEFAITQRAGGGRPRAWVSLSATSPDNGIDLASIDGALVAGPSLTAGGDIDPACRYRVVFANNGEYDERGHDDYAKAYPCAPFLAGGLDAAVIADLRRWAADLVRQAGP